MKNTNKIPYKVTIYVILLFLITTYIAMAHRNYTKEIEKEKLIAHAMGEVDNITYTNSLEAFKHNYNEGFRIFEIDLVMTSDNNLVLRHYWNKDNLNKNNLKDRITLKEFNNTKILKKYTPIDITTLYNLLEQHDDVYFILDIKETDRETIKNCFKYLKNTLKSKDKELKNRIIPQVLSEEMYYDMKNILDFPIVYYGLYSTNIDKEKDNILKFIEKEKIFAISMWSSAYNKEFTEKVKNLGVKVYVHTINSKDKVLFYLKEGVDGLYTDFIKKEEISDT